MSTGPQQNKQPEGLRDSELMAVVLEGRHGALAADVAEFFATLHRQHGDPNRSKAWTGVARLVRKREYERLLDS
jgi:hypothetical protein